MVSRAISYVFLHNKRGTPPPNTPYLTHLPRQNLRSVVNSHYTLAQGKSSPPTATSWSALSEAWMIKWQLGGHKKKNGEESSGIGHFGCTRGGRLRTRKRGRINRTRMPRQQEHQETKTATDKDGGGRKNKIKSCCGRKSGSQGGGKRKKDGGCRRRQTGEMKSVPRGAHESWLIQRRSSINSSHTHLPPIHRSLLHYLHSLVFNPQRLCYVTLNPHTAKTHQR